MSEGQGDTGGFNGMIPVNSLPADIQSEGALKNYITDGNLDLGKALKGHVELNRTFHARSMADLDPPSDDAARRAVLAKLGHAPPESPDKYDLPNAPEDLRERFHKAGLTQEQAKALVEADAATRQQTETERKTRMEQRKSEAERALRAEWGDKYDENMQLAQRGAEHFLKDENFRKFLAEAGIAQHPDMQKLLYGVGRALKEGTMHTGTGAGVGQPQTVEAAQKAINDFMADENNRKLVLSQNDRMPGVKEAKEELGRMRGHLAKLRVSQQNDAAGVAPGSQQGG